MTILFEPEKIYEVEVEGLLSRKGQREIEKLVKDNYGWEMLLDDFGGFELVNGNGKITKRIKNTLYKQRGVSIDSHDVSEIGNIANNNTVEEGKYIFTISHDMNVFKGQHRTLYTNKDTMNPSCFQPGGAYHYHWLAMDRNDRFYAVKVSMADEPDELIARCWLMIDEVHDQLVIFNGYGLTLNEIGVLMSRALDVGVVNGYVYRADVYVNGEGKCRILYPKDGVYRREVDIVAGADDSLHSCQVCNTVFSSREEGLVWGGSAYCSNHSGYCDRCGNHHPLHTLTGSETNPEQQICNPCQDTERERFYCRNCNTRHDDLRALSHYNGRYCQDCIHTCHECGRDAPERHVEEIAGEEYCHRCQSLVRLRLNCCECGSEFSEENPVIFQDNEYRYCRECCDECDSCDGQLPYFSLYRQQFNDGEQYNFCGDCRANHIDIGAKVLDIYLNASVGEERRIRNIHSIRQYIEDSPNKMFSIRVFVDSVIRRDIKTLVAETISAMLPDTIDARPDLERSDEEWKTYLTILILLVSLDEGEDGNDEDNEEEDYQEEYDTGYVDSGSSAEPFTISTSATSSTGGNVIFASTLGDWLDSIDERMLHGMWAVDEEYLGDE